MTTGVDETVRVAAEKRIEVEVVVTDAGRLVMSPAEVEQLELVPGQRVRISVPDHRRSALARRDLYGILAGRVRPLTYEDFDLDPPEVPGNDD